MSVAFYRIEHDTRYVHAAPVSMSQHVAYLAPRRLARQTVHGYALEVEPEVFWRRGGPPTAARAGAGK